MPLFYGFCSETFLSEHGLCVTLHFVRLWHSIGRVVYRGYNNANANGGVSFANATNDASNTNTNVGSRLDNYKSAYINGDVSPSTCREGRASAKAHDAESRNTQWSGRVW